MTGGQGPFHNDEYLGAKGHCKDSCFCNRVYVECFLGIFSLNQIEKYKTIEIFSFYTIKLEMFVTS